MIAGFWLILLESDTVFDGFNLLMPPFVASPLQQESTTTGNEIGRSPSDKRVVAVGVDSNFNGLLPF